jgi:hypothetical protein
MKDRIEILEAEIEYWKIIPKTNGLIEQLQTELNNLKQFQIYLDYIENL